MPDEDAETWVRLRDAGAILLGKQETHEFAIGGPDFTLPFEPARNPWNTAHYPAGSSSGSAVAVAAGLCAAAMGSDTGGSIRGPAAYCGIVGLKPTYGRVSRRGVFPLSYTLDHCGPLTRTVEDCAIMMQALGRLRPAGPGLGRCSGPGLPRGADDAPRRGEDRRDPPFPRARRRRRFRVRQRAELRPISRPSTPLAGRLESLGARLVDLQLSPLIDYVDANRLIMMAEAYALHEKDFRERPQDFGHHMFARIGLGAFLSAADYVEATRQRRELCVEFARAIDGLDRGGFG